MMILRNNARWLCLWFRTAAEHSHLRLFLPYAPFNKLQLMTKKKTCATHKQTCSDMPETCDCHLWELTPHLAALCLADPSERFPYRAERSASIALLYRESNIKIEQFSSLTGAKVLLLPLFTEKNKLFVIIYASVTSSWPEELRDIEILSLFPHVLPWCFKN